MNKNTFIAGLFCAIYTSIYLGNQTIATPISSELASQNYLLDNKNQIALNNSQSQSQDNSTKVILFVSLIGTGMLFWHLSQSRQRQGNKSSFQTLNSKSNTPLLDRVSPKLRRQLLRLVNDPKTANRLLTGIYKNNSDRSANWLAEKAIYDLRRGR